MDTILNNDEVKPNKIPIQTEPCECITLISDNEEEEGQQEKEQVDPNIHEETENGESNHTNSNENLSTPIPDQRLNNSHVTEIVLPLVTPQLNRVPSQSGSSTKSTTIRRERKPKPCPPYKIVEDTNFAVDAFQYGYIENVTHYFLTHFHADHYIGLTRSFSKPLYMSRITARLVRHFIPLEEKFIHEMDLNVPIEVDGVHMVALDANHCPGAIMLLFKTKKSNKFILHTGDFRARQEMESIPFFWNHQIDTIYLDTTYISNNYAFCTQYESITRAKIMVDKFREEHKEKKILFVCGSYVIGKEKFWSAIAEEYQLKVWAEENRMKALKAMEIEEYTKWLVNDPHQADMHILAMGKLSYLHLVEHFIPYENEYDCLLALRPSGWEKDSKPQYRGKINIIGIEYSEHSSYEEMKRFIKFLKPEKVISTVPVGRDLMQTAHVPEKWYKYNKLQSSSNYQPRLDEYMGRTPKRKTNSIASIRLPNAEKGGLDKFVSPIKKNKTKEINNNGVAEEEEEEAEEKVVISIHSTEECTKLNKTTNVKKKKIKTEIISPEKSQVLIKNQELKEGEMCSIFIENISQKNSSDLFESSSACLNETKKKKNNKKNTSHNFAANEKKMETPMNSENSSDYFESNLSKSNKNKTLSSRKNSSEEIPNNQNRRITRQTSKLETKRDTPSVPSTISEEELSRQIKLMQESPNAMKNSSIPLIDLRESQINPLLKSNTNSTISGNAMEKEEESIYYKSTNELKLDLIMDDSKSEMVPASQTTMDLLNTPRPLRSRINYYSISQNLQEEIPASQTTATTTDSRPFLKNSMKYAFCWQQEGDNADDIIPASQTSKDLANTPRPIRSKRQRSSKSSNDSESPPKMSRQNSLRLDKIVEENNELNSHETSEVSSDKQSSRENIPLQLSYTLCSSQSNVEEEQSSNDSKNIYNISKIVKKVFNTLSQKEPDTSVDHIPPELLSPVDLDADDDWI